MKVSHIVYTCDAYIQTEVLISILRSLMMLFAIIMQLNHKVNSDRFASSLRYCKSPPNVKCSYYLDAML